MPELSDLVRNLEEFIARFHAWADAYPPAERSGAWACAYTVPIEDWSAVYDAVRAFLTATTCDRRRH